MFTMGCLFEDWPGARTGSPEQLRKECQSKDTTVDNFNNFTLAQLIFIHLHVGFLLPQQVDVFQEIGL